MVRITTTRSAVIASPDRWIAGVHAAALRFVVWEPHQVRSGWLGAALTLAHATSRSVVPLAGIALDGGAWSTQPGPSELHELTRAPAHALVHTCALRYGDLVTLHGSAGRGTRLYAREAVGHQAIRLSEPPPTRWATDQLG